MKVPKAYSYLRFSTPEQAKGDSFRRQSEASRTYARKHGLDLDETLSFKDLGVSAFRGKNAQDGALGAFLSAVEAGKIKRGSYLLVENLDRLSRDTVRSAFIQFTGILERGVNIATLTDGKLYTAARMDSDFGDLMFSLTTMFRAHDESALKSKRLSAAWQAKRDKAQADGKKLTARCPAWLTLASDRKNFKVDTARKKIVRRIFDMTNAGHGKTVIVRRFNAESVPTFGNSKGWHSSYVQKILENEAVTGTFQAMKIEVKGGKKKRVPDGAPIPDYFPPVVDRATFERARQSRLSRRIPVGKKGLFFTNLFSGLAVCGECGATMHYISKGAAPKGGNYLVCSNARRAVANCKAKAWKYEPVEALLILCLEEIDFGELFPEITTTAREALQALEDQKLETESELCQAGKKLENIADLLIDNPDQPTLKARLHSTQTAHDELKTKLAVLNGQLAEERDSAKNAEHDFGQVKDGLDRLDKAHKAKGADLYDLRSRLNQLFKRTIQQIQIHPAKGAAFKPEHASEWVGAIVVGFQLTKLARALYVKKGMRDCHSVPVRNGKPDFKRAVTLTTQGP